MKTEKLFSEIGKIDDGMIAEANADSFKHQSVTRTWSRLIAAFAACLVVVVGILARYHHNPVPIKPAVPNLPMLTVSNDSGTFGFEGYLAYDISELQNGNPWSENDGLNTLPVFQNPTSYDNLGQPIKGLSADEMIQKAEETALALGLTVDSAYTNPTEEDLQAWREKERSIPGNERFEPDTTPYEAIVACGDVTIRAKANGLIRIFFDNGVQLPNEYSFPVEAESYTAEIDQAGSTLLYLLDAYKSVVTMNAPAIGLFCDYNIYGQLQISYKAYEGQGDLLEKLLGYNFNWIKFAPNSAGELWVIDRHEEDLSQKIGDYPIISAKEARKLLLQNHYITTVPEALPGEAHIASVELIYRTDRYDEVFMPYYRFLAELPAMQRDNGLKTFGAFYVPAVEGRYLTNMPLWDGSFN